MTYWLKDKHNIEMLKPKLVGSTLTNVVKDIEGQFWFWDKAKEAMHGPYINAALAFTFRMAYLKGDFAIDDPSYQEISDFELELGDLQTLRQKLARIEMSDIVNLTNNKKEIEQLRVKYVASKYRFIKKWTPQQKEFLQPSDRDIFVRRCDVTSSDMTLVVTQDERKRGLWFCLQDKERNTSEAALIGWSDLSELRSELTVAIPPATPIKNKKKPVTRKRKSKKQYVTKNVPQ